MRRETVDGMLPGAPLLVASFSYSPTDKDGRFAAWEPPELLATVPRAALRSVR
jgi:hypothetical protein